MQFLRPVKTRFPAPPVLKNLKLADTITRRTILQKVPHTHL